MAEQNGRDEDLVSPIPDEQAEETQEKMNIGGLAGFLQDVQDLPLALSRLVLRHVLLCLAALFIAALLYLYLRTLHPLLLVALAIWAIWNVISIVTDWHHGSITEKAVVCVSATRKWDQKKTNVTFRSANEESPDFYSFLVPESSKVSDFTPGGIYIIYTRNSMPDVLMTWIAM